MADDTETPVQAAFPGSVPQDGKLDPGLQQLNDAFDGDAKDWAGDILSRVQQHINMTRVADANSAAGQQFENTISGIKDNLLGMVKADPTSVGLSLDLAPKLIGPLIHGTIDDPNVASQAHDELTSSVQKEIAHTAVMRMADFHGDAAHQLMDGLSGYISDDEKNVLGTYINTLQVARTADAAGMGNTVLSGQQRASGIAAYRYGSTLLDPRTEDVTVPGGYLENLVRNQSIAPQDKQPLFDAYNRLLSNGDVHASDPYAVAKVLGDISSPRTDVSHGDIMSHVGDDLRYVDALMLHGMNLQRTPDNQAAVRSLGELMNHAQSVLASGGDRAGNAAYGRFANWLLPAIRRTGLGGLDPNSDTYLFKNTNLDGFKPTHVDAVAPMPKGRMSLGQIFGGSNGSV